MTNIPIVQIGVMYDYTRFSCQQMMKQQDMFYYCDDLHISLSGLKRAAYKFHNSQKINSIFNLPLRNMWAKEIIPANFRSKLNSDEPICFIYQGGQSYLDIDAFSYLRKCYPKSILIYKYNDLVALNERLYPGFLERCRKTFDLIMTYNIEDAEKYDLINEMAMISDYSTIVPSLEQKKSDIFYIGRNKERLDELIHLFELCRSNGLTCDFNIIDVVPSQQLYKDEISYNRVIPYMEMLQRVRNAKCVLNVIQKGAQGITLRDYESIGMGKLLMTNNHYIESTDMFDPNQVIFTDGEINFDKIRNYHDTTWNCVGVKKDVKNYLIWMNNLINNYIYN